MKTLEDIDMRVIYLFGEISAIQYRKLFREVVQTRTGATLESRWTEWETAQVQTGDGEKNG